MKTVILSILVLGVCIIVATAYPTFSRLPHGHKQPFPNDVQQEDKVGQNLLDRFNIPYPQHDPRPHFEVEKQRGDHDENVNAVGEGKLHSDKTAERRHYRKNLIEIRIYFKKLLAQAIEAGREYLKYLEAERQGYDQDEDVNSAVEEKKNFDSHEIAKLVSDKEDLEMEGQRVNYVEDVNSANEHNLGTDETAKLDTDKEYKAEMRQEGATNENVNSAGLVQEEIPPKDDYVDVNSVGEKNFDSDAYKSANAKINELIARIKKILAQDSQTGQGDYHEKY